MASAITVLGSIYTPLYTSEYKCGFVNTPNPSTAVGSMMRYSVTPLK